MSNYNTKQKQALLASLDKHPDELVSAKQLADELQDEKISLSSVGTWHSWKRKEKSGAAPKMGPENFSINTSPRNAARECCT